MHCVTCAPPRVPPRRRFESRWGLPATSLVSCGLDDVWTFDLVSNTWTEVIPQTAMPATCDIQQLMSAGGSLGGRAERDVATAAARWLVVATSAVVAAWCTCDKLTL